MLCENSNNTGLFFYGSRGYVETSTAPSEPDDSTLHPSQSAEVASEQRLEPDSQALIDAHVISPIAGLTPRIQAMKQQLAKASGEPIPDFAESCLQAIPVQVGGLHPVSDLWYIERQIDTPDELRLQISGLVHDIVQSAQLQVEIYPATTGAGYTLDEPDSPLFDPVPDARFAERLASSAHAELVDSNSPLWMHEAVYQRARAFRREFRYDRVPWDGSNERRASERWHGYLFAGDSDGTIAGACGFYHGRSDQEVGRWGLHWIWLAPKFRRQGILKARWDDFLSRYGGLH